MILTKFSILIAALLAIVGSCNAQDSPPAADKPATNQPPGRQVDDGATGKAEREPSEQKLPRQVDADLYRKTVSSAVNFLLQKGQDRDDGSYSKQLGPAVTALCTTALLKNGHSLKDPKIQKSLTYLEKFVQDDGGVYAPDSNLQNYETSVAVMCFVEANENGKYDRMIEDAIGYQKKIQWDAGESHDRTSTFFGGQGYGTHKRPDASNTSFFMDALKAAGEDADSESIQKAITFMSRTQNLTSQYNAMEFATKATAEDRGGFIYSPVGKGESKAGQSPTGGLRSYASMTYAGLKSFLYAGLKKDDVRVQAALDWIRRHYDLKTNPGMGKEGLYYYYHVFARALDANRERFIKDSNDVEHNWRAELVGELAATQKQDGSWTNQADRWYEGDPNLVTSYSLLALSYCHPDKDK